MAQKSEKDYYHLIEEWPKTVMTELVLPGMTNSHGTLFGGAALEMMDKAAAVVALRHANKSVVTAGMDSVSFVAPIEEAEIVEVTASLKSVGRSSMKVQVEVWGEDPFEKERKKCTEATLTMVAVDSEGKPSEVPSLFSSLSGEEKERVVMRAKALKKDKVYQEVLDLCSE